MTKRIFVFIMLGVFMTARSHEQDIKESVLAGSWYPASKAQLQAMLDGYMKKASAGEVKGDILAIISPHAGYQFSGPVAAYGFNAVKGKGFKSVVVVGFSHRVFFDGISVYDKGLFTTPLGDIAIDETLAREMISKHKRIKFEPRIFDGESSVEMQIPFIQASLRDAKIVPVVF